MPAFLNKQNGFAPILILLVIVLIGIGGAYYFGKLKPTQLNSASNKQTNNASQPDQASNLKIYTNTDFKYSVKYPSDTFVRLICPLEELTLIKREPNELRDQINMPNCYRAGRYAIEIVTSSGNDGHLDTEPSDSDFYKVSKEEVKIGSITARKYIVSYIGENLSESANWYAEAFINHDGITHQIYTADKQLLPIFDQILSTFKFTDQSDISNWKIHNRGQYSFKYPDNWTDDVSEQRYSEPGIIMHTKDVAFTDFNNVSQGAFIYVPFAGITSPAESLKDLFAKVKEYSTGNKKIISESNFTLNNQPAMKRLLVKDNVSEEQIVFEYPTSAENIKYSYIILISNPKNFTKAEQEFNQMLSTFKFEN